MKQIIAGDMGGTKTSFAFYQTESNPRQAISKTRLRNKDFASILDMMKALPAEFISKESLLVLGVAGPVMDQRVQLTNINWKISAAELEKELGLGKVVLLNDLEASAEAIEILEPDEIWVLMEGNTSAQGNIAVIAPGTGLGEAFISTEGGVRITHATEGGHTDFAPKNSQQAELLDFLSKEFQHVSVEKVCSGIGIPNIYRFLQQTIEESAEHANEITKSEDISASIFKHASDPSGECQICGEVLRIFLEILGAEAGNLALKTGATGGVFIGGGIPPKIRDAFDLDIFRKYFLDKGRQKKYMEQIPVRMILNSQSPLMGAAHYAFKILAT